MVDDALEWLWHVPSSTYLERRIETWRCLVIVQIVSGWPAWDAGPMPEICVLYDRVERVKRSI